MLAGGTRAVASRSGGGRPECRVPAATVSAAALKEKARPLRARGDGSVAAAIARDCGRHGGEAAPDPAASSRSNTPAVASTRL